LRRRLANGTGYDQRDDDKTNTHCKAPTDPKDQRHFLPKRLGGNKATKRAYFGNGERQPAPPPYMDNEL